MLICEESEWVERTAKTVMNVGDLWFLQRGLVEIAKREVERLNRLEAELRADTPINAGKETG